MSATITFVGRVGRDPETKTVGQHEVCEISCAVDTGWGEKKVTTWYRASIWGKPAAAAKAQLKTGSQVYIVGEFTPREYTTREGKHGVAYEVRVDRWEHVGARQEWHARVHDGKAKK